MKSVVILTLCLLTGLILNGQSIANIEEGRVSFVTSQNIYVKFNSTKNIAIGDTLFIQKDGEKIPTLIVTNLSSMSCVCVPLDATDLSVDDKVFLRSKPVKITPNAELTTPEEPLPEVKIDSADSSPKEPEAKNQFNQEIGGRVSISSYSNFSNRADFSQRMRYTFSINAKNISDSKFSTESYISFATKNNDWEEIKENVFNGLKIYNLAVKYELNPSIDLVLGRKINPKISNIGAVDGLQAEWRYKSFSFGGVIGSRPDYSDYGINTSLFQFGGYVNHEYSHKNGFMQSSLAFIEQKNSGNIDRRFTYFQHSNSLVKNLYFFGSMEINLYKKVNEQTDNHPSVSNLYLMLRYRISRQLTISASYSARDNIIYYETYKDIVERLLEQEALQGYRARITFRPVKYLSLGVNGGYRFRNDDPKPSKNLYFYATHSRIPLIDASTTVSFTLLETSYLSGRIYSIIFNKDLIKSKLFGGLGYRYVDYTYLSSEYSIPQNMAELSLSWKIMKRLFASLNYEGTFESQSNYNRIYINLTQRF